MTLGVLTTIMAAPPATAYDHDRGAREASLAFYALEPRIPAVRLAGRTLAAFDVGDQAVTLTAYGRRARARAMGRVEDLHHARAMGKVFEGAPQPALLTFEVSLRF